MWFIGVEVEQETSAPPPKKNPGSAPANDDLISNKNELIIKTELRVLHLLPLDTFRLVSLIDALPTQWRESLKTCISTGDTPFNLRDEIKLRLSGQTVLLERAFSKIV